MTPRPIAGLRRAHAGFSIVELLVALGISLALTLAVSLMLIRQDADKRATVSTNDAQLNAAYVTQFLDRHLRSAGSGFTQGWQANVGCLLRASRGGVQLLPRAAAFPAPFAAVSGQYRMAPVIIHAGAGTAGSDVLALAAGSSGLGEAAVRVLPGSITAASLRIPNTIGLRGDDLLMVAEPGVGCMLQQVASPFTGGATQQLNLAGSYAAASVGGFALTGFGTSGNVQMSALGNPNGNPPMLMFIGIGDNATLFHYDLLGLNGAAVPQPVTEGVVQLRALYGVDTNSDAVLDQWVAPTAAGYTAAELLDGSDAAQLRLRSILAVRVGAIFRTDRSEKENVAPASLTLFDDLGANLRQTVTLATDAQRYRHRSIEVTVPLRNVMQVTRP